MKRLISIVNWKTWWLCASLTILQLLLSLFESLKALSYFFQPLFAYIWLHFLTLSDTDCAEHETITVLLIKVLKCYVWIIFVFCESTFRRQFLGLFWGLINFLFLRLLACSLALISLQISIVGLWDAACGFSRFLLLNGLSCSQFTSLFSRQVNFATAWWCDFLRWLHSSFGSCLSSLVICHLLGRILLTGGIRPSHCLLSRFVRFLRGLLSGISLDFGLCAVRLLKIFLLRAAVVDEID